MFLLERAAVQVTSEQRASERAAPVARWDVVVVGAGAAGLFASIQAGRAAHGLRILALDGAQRLGAKILVAGGGRCNVTHYAVDETNYAGSSRNAIKKVLRRFGVADTRRFFSDLGVDLKREETGKLFPTTDNAHTVLDALLGAARDAKVVLKHPARVTRIETLPSGGFLVGGPAQQADSEGAGGARALAASPWGEVVADRVILATGGRALPRTGSDGLGHDLVRGLGHTITKRVFPALVPMTLPRDHFVCGLSGVAVEATLEVRTSSGKRLASFTNSLLCTHFGVSGPAAMDISRHYTDALRDDPGSRLVVSWLPSETGESVDAALRDLGRRTPAQWLRERLPERLAAALPAQASVDPDLPGAQLSKDARRALVEAITAMPLPITGDRGWNYAEVTAGGVPLSEIRLETMESRVCPGLHLCGEICDVDGRIGGFNFQWAWASGFVAGTGAAAALAANRV